MLDTAADRAQGKPQGQRSMIAIGDYDAGAKLAGKTVNKVWRSD
jgi:hypothetical protein